MASRPKPAIPRFNVTQLSELFGLHRNTVKRHLANVEPCGQCKRGFDQWSLPVAAAHLVKTEPATEMDEDLDPDTLPPDIAKDYWDAQLKKQKYQQQDGELWHTLDVFDMLNGLFEPVKFSLRSLTDTVERRANLSPQQVELVQKEVDSTLKTLYESLVDYGSVPESE